MKILNYIFLKIIFCLFLKINTAYSQALSIGQFSVGPSSVDLQLDDFRLSHTNKLIKTEFIKESLEWRRLENNLLTPFVLVRIVIPDDLKSIYFKVDQQKIFPAKSLKNLHDLQSQIFINLFHPSPIEVYNQNQKIDQIQITAHNIQRLNHQQWIDFTCLPFKFEITGVEQQYSSTGCKLYRIGSFGHERPRLEVTFSSPHLKTKADDLPPFVFNFSEKSNVAVTFIDKVTLKEVPVQISVDLPERLHRLKLAAGIGPYFFSNQYESEKQGPKAAPAYMLYGKFDLSETSSLKAFDALIYDNDSLFNNSGFYFSYDLAQLHDGQIVFGALLGFQGLHHKYKKSFPTDFEIIYPQGFELTYYHAFGIKNYSLTYGMFLSTTEDLYRNIWLRSGGKVFYELNYITWGSKKAEIEMWGLSIGFPLMQAF